MTKKTIDSNQSNNLVPDLDGAAWKAVRPVGNDLVDNAAVALDALAVAVRGWCAAKQELSDAEAEASKCVEAVAAEAGAVADRLRGEAERRRGEADAYAEAVTAKCCEVARIHPDLSGAMLPLRQYATGEIPVDKPVQYFHPCGEREYVPEVTDANRDVLAAFVPVKRSPPDTSALDIPSTLAAAFVRVAEARERYEGACKTLVDAVALFRDSSADLAEEAEVEAESVAEAVRIQRERNE